MSDLRENRVRACHYHCRACECCFSSLAAFDRHRRGPLDERYCGDPNALPALVYEDAPAQCEISFTHDGEDVLVWQLATSAGKDFSQIFRTSTPPLTAREQLLSEFSGLAIDKMEKE